MTKATVTIDVFRKVPASNIGWFDVQRWDPTVGAYTHLARVRGEHLADDLIEKLSLKFNRKLGG